uniref:Uncharacterized protein n=1 Tax=Brassica oleracea var. oleracea TaxID=109376 RepID=A0A0D3DM55_BRAOL
MDEIRSFEKASLFDLGHPLLNRIADSFVKAAGVRAGFDANMGPPSENASSKKHRFPNLRVFRGCEPRNVEKRISLDEVSIVSKDRPPRPRARTVSTRVTLPMDEDDPHRGHLAHGRGPTSCPETVHPRLSSRYTILGPLDTIPMSRLA